jgi:branched-chain amino acid transport system substrate-binding protein
MFTASGGTITYRPIKKWVFKGIADDEDFIPAALQYLAQKKMRRIAIIRDTGALGADVEKNMRAKIIGTDMTIVSDEVYAPNDTDMSPQVIRMVATKPDAIINIATIPAAAAIIAKEIYQHGSKQPVVTAYNLQSSTFVKLAGSAVEQVVFIGLKSLLPDASNSGPMGTRFDAFRAEFGKLYPNVEVVPVNTVCADAILLTQAAAKSLGAKALDGAQLRAALESLSNAPAFQGDWSFSPSSHESSLINGIAMVQYKNGKWVKAQ